MIQGLSRRVLHGLRDSNDRGRKATRAEKAAVKKKIWAGVKAGTITEEQAKKRWESYRKRLGGDGFVDHYRKMGVSAETLGRVKKALVENGIKGKQIEAVLGAMIRVKRLST